MFQFVKESTNREKKMVNLFKKNNNKKALHNEKNYPFKKNLQRLKN
jgi:hypothetical protein